MNTSKTETYQATFQTAVIDLILNIQQQEFNVPITIENQPDLLDIPTFYQQKNGNFWVQLFDNQVVGTIALIDIGNQQGCIRKMFVKSEFRGKEWGIAQSLLNELTTWAKNRQIQELFLGTLTIMQAAHRFYQKNGFTEIDKNDLPINFPLMAVDNLFFKKSLLDFRTQQIGGSLQ
jgi:N-acetylglutamate synthase-like GNAT family acetyltransferase